MFKITTLNEYKNELQSYEKVETAYKFLRMAFTHSQSMNKLLTEMESEDKRLKMLHRNPILARQMYPFNKRMGIEGFLKVKNGKSVMEPVNDDFEAQMNGEKLYHIQIDEKFLRTPLDPKDERVI